MTRQPESNARGCKINGRDCLNNSKLNRINTYFCINVQNPLTRHSEEKTEDVQEIDCKYLINCPDDYRRDSVYCYRAFQYDGDRDSRANIDNLITLRHRACRRAHLRSPLILRYSFRCIHYKSDRSYRAIQSGLGNIECVYFSRFGFSG